LFVWPEVEPAKPAAKSVGDWIEAFEVDFWRTKIKDDRAEAIYRKDYGFIFQRMVTAYGNCEISIDLLVEIVANWSVPDSRMRNRYCMCVGRLAEFAGLDRSGISRLRGSRGIKPINNRDIPSPEDILKWHSLIGERSPEWARIFGFYATYGIRPSELWQLDLSDYHNGYHEVWVNASKTGVRRVTYPVPYEWFDLFDLGALEIPDNLAKIPEHYGNFATRKFEKLGVDLNCYTLRHYHAVQLILAGIDTSTAAKWMGHSEAVFSQVYLHWMNVDRHRAIFDRLRK
jgi:integrase